MSDDRKQSETILVITVVACLCLSHFIAAKYPNLWGNDDLRRWLFFWNKPLTINWPAAILLWIISLFAGKRLHHYAITATVRRRKEEAKSLHPGEGDDSNDSNEYKPIL